MEELVVVDDDKARGAPDDANFDADTADQVLQVAVLGEIR